MIVRTGFRKVIIGRWVVELVLVNGWPYWMEI